MKKWKFSIGFNVHFQTRRADNSLKLPALWMFWVLFPFLRYPIFIVLSFLHPPTDGLNVLTLVWQLSLENPLMNVGVVGLQEPLISVTLYISKTYLLSATQTPTQRSDRSYVRNAPRYEPTTQIMTKALETKPGEAVHWLRTRNEAFGALDRAHNPEVAGSNPAPAMNPRPQNPDPFFSSKSQFTHRWLLVTAVLANFIFDFSHCFWYGMRKGISRYLGGR